MKTILVVDDEEAIAQIIEEAIKESIPGVRCVQETDFSKALSLISDLRPDAIVLDLMEGHQSTNLPGQPTWKSMWEHRLCPLVVYTGWEGDLDPPIPEDHPLVTMVKKGLGSEKNVVNQLKLFIPATLAVRALRDEIDAVIHQVLRETMAKGVIDGKDKDQLLHACRRRIAASMDDPTITSQRPLFSWEAYLIPAMGNDPLTGDLLRIRGSPKDDPSSYRLLLTPSCDTARGGKVKTVLVAKCHPLSAMVERLKSSVKETDPIKLSTHVQNLVLSQGAWNGWLPLPEVGSLLPGMVAWLKDLEVIPLEAICPDDSSKPGFDRIASIDSPFREQIAWSYLTTAARPGMPERDLKAWADQCVKPAPPAAAASKAPPRQVHNSWIM